MLRFKAPVFAIGAVMLTVCAPASRAAMAVVDVKAIGQLIEQISIMQQQLDTVRLHLDQARLEYSSITGPRGMESLLSDTVRNYLPPDWAQVTDAIRQTSATYRALSNEIRRVMEANAILDPQAMAKVPPNARELLEDERRAAAAMHVMSGEALATTSNRFTSIQRLIDAIPNAQDQKAVLDLQARIQAEQGMLANEQTKLQLLRWNAEAEDSARRLRVREQLIAGIGSWRDLPPLRLPVN